MTTITVNSTAGFQSALRVAQAGDIIQLQSGTYNGTEFYHHDFGAGITITSVNPAQPAVLTDFVMEDVKGVAFRDLEFQVKPGSLVGFNVYSSENITFDKVHMHGSLDNNSSNDGEGLRFFDSKNIRVTDSEFEQLSHGVSFARSADIVASGNHLHDLDSDGMDLGQVDRVTLSNNVFHDFRPTDGAHPDAIQFLTGGTTVASHDILITGNLIYRGEGEYTQGIFMSDEAGNLPFERVTISNNTIIGTGWNAIRTTHNVDLTITGNRLISLAGDNDTYLLVQNAAGVVAANNQATSISFATSTSVNQTNNTLNVAATDAGVSILKSWLIASNGHADLLTELVPGYTAPSQAPAPPTTPTVPVTPMTPSNPVGGGSNAGNDLADVPSHLLSRLPGSSESAAAAQKISGAGELRGGSGADTITGQSGSDVAGGAGDDSISAIDGANVLRGDDGSDTIAGGQGFDDINGNMGDDVGSGGAGNDWVLGGRDNDRLGGDDGDDFVHGNIGADTLEGGVGADTVRGGQDNDVLNGGAGNDFLSGDRGDDVVTGGAGADTFHSFGQAGIDRILDFNGLEGDRIDLEAGDTYTLSQVGADTVINMAGGGQVVLANVQLASLHSDWIIGH